MGIGNAATAAPMGIFGLFWNPALEAVQDGTWCVASGFSALDTSNIASPILQYSEANAAQSQADPIHRVYHYSGVFGVKYTTLSFGALYDQDLDYLATQRTLDFYADRAAGTLGAGATYALDHHETQDQIATLVLSYSSQLPLSSFQFLSVGGSLKYHYGTRFHQTTLTGAYTQGLGTGYQYTKIDSTSGLGLSTDLGFFAKVTDSLQVGFMMQNLQSDLKWQGTQQAYTLDPVTGQETASGAAVPVTVSAPLPYTTKLGVAIAPPDKNIYLEVEVSWVNQTTHWRAGLERYYPDSGLAVRLGTFADEVSGQQLWTFGLGFQRANFSVDIAGVTRSVPDIQNSIALGGAIDLAFRF